MDKSFNQVVAQLTEFVRGLTLKQKAVLAGGALLVSATLFAFVHFINRPELKTLYSGLKPDEARTMASRLDAKKISYSVSPDGASISVPAEDLDAARLEAVAEGVPHSGRMGFEIFDKPDWMGNDFTEKVNYQRALEGELERTIQTLSEVESARVHLVLPGESMFLDDQREAKAAVTLKLKGSRFSEDTAKAVSRLVASAVDRLRPENVTVVDADTNQSLSSSSGRISRGDAELEQQLADTLIRTLEPVVGPQKARASVRIEYDPTSSEENQESYDPNKVVAVAMQKSEEVSGSKRVGGVPGTASNVPGSQSTQVAADRVEDGSQSSRAENGTYVVNKILRHTILPAGRIKRIAAALVVDDVAEITSEGGQKKESRRKRTPEELKQIEEIAKAAVGIDTARGDLLSVQNLSFIQQVEDKPAKPGALEKTKKIANDYSGVLRYLSIGVLFAVIYFLLLRPVKKQVLAVLLSSGFQKGRLTGEGRGGWDSDRATQIEANAINLGDASPESRRTIALKQHLLEKVKSEPAAATRLVQGWMRQERAE